MENQQPQGNAKGAENPLLMQTEQAVLEKVKPELKGTIQRIVLAGKKVMYSEQTADLMTEQLKEPGDPAQIAGQGVAKLFVLLLQQSIPKNGGQPTLNMDAAMPAMQILLGEALGFMEEAGIVQITPDLLAQATQEMMSAIMQFLGVTPEKLQQMAAEKQGGGQPAGGAGPTGTPPADVAGAQPAPAGGMVDQAMGG